MEISNLFSSGEGLITAPVLGIVLVTKLPAELEKVVRTPAPPAPLAPEPVAELVALELDVEAPEALEAPDPVAAAEITVVV